MDLDFFAKLIRQAFLTTLIVASPILGTSLVIGLVVSIFQTTTSIQEQTLTFVPKFIGILLAIIFFSSFIFQVLANFANNLFLMLPNMVQ